MLAPSHPPPPTPPSATASSTQTQATSLSTDPAPTTDTHHASFQTLLDADSTTDEPKLRRAAASGIPPDLRPILWPMLLCHSAFSAPDALAHHHHKRRRDYQNLSLDTAPRLDPDIARKIRTVLSRSHHAYQPPSPTPPKRSSPSSSTDTSDHQDPLQDEQVPELHIPLPTRQPRPTPGANALVFVHGSHSKLRVVDTNVVATFTRVIATYLQTARANVDFHPDMVYLCAPFVELMPSECDAYYAFHALMQRHDHLFCEDALHDAVSQFITIFRVLHPDLHDHFISEDVELKLFVAKWLRGLFVQQLPRPYLLRLWDSYFANLPDQGLDLHPYVCLVFIDSIKAELQECDDGERITSLLGKLKPLDIDYVIAHAIIIRAQLRERDIL